MSEKNTPQLMIKVEVDLFGDYKYQCPNNCGFSRKGRTYESKCPVCKQEIEWGDRKSVV